MANNLKKEVFTKGFDSNNSPLLLENGTIADGKNIRPIGNRGGWKGRTGSTLRNTTAAGSAVVEGIPYYNPITDYFRLLFHYGDYFYTGAASLTQATGLGTSLGLDIGTSVGHFCRIGEQLFYANGDGPPVVYSGDTVYPKTVLFHDLQTAASDPIYMDVTNEAIDGETTTYAKFSINSDRSLYICGYEKLEEAIFTLSSYNFTASVLAVSAWRSGSWTAVSGLSDGTDVGGVTMKQSGTVSWTASTSDELKVINGVMGYWYKVTASAGFSSIVSVGTIKVKSPLSLMTNKWNGIYQYATGVIFYNETTGIYSDELGDVSNESQSTYMSLSDSTVNDFIYIKNSSPLAGVGFAMVEGQENSTTGEIDDIEYWAGTSWVSLTDLDDVTTDGTSSFAKTGQVFWDFNTNHTPIKRTLKQDNVSGYWYRVSWDAALSTNTQVYLVVVAEQPATLYNYEGCEEYEGRLILWGDKRYRNRLKYSPVNKPDAIGGTNSEYTDVFGGAESILVAKKFSSYLFVGKKQGIFLMDENLSIIQVSIEVGVISGKTVQVIESGTSNMQKELIINVVIWLDADGVYQYDLKGISKISLPIDNYFDSNSDDYLTIAAIEVAKSFIDQERNEYHLLIGTTELVYNYAYQIWYPPWDREIPITNGISFRADDNAFYSFGFASSGFALQLENGTSERDTANAEVAVLPELRTRAISPNESGIGVAFTLRSIWIVAKADNVNAPNFSINVYKNLGTVALSGYSSQFAKDNHSLVIIQLDFSELDCTVFEVKINSTGTDAEMEIYEILYEYEERSRILNDD